MEPRPCTWDTCSPDLFCENLAPFWLSTPSTILHCLTLTSHHVPPISKSHPNMTSTKGHTIHQEITSSPSRTESFKLISKYALDIWSIFAHRILTHRPRAKLRTTMRSSEAAIAWQGPSPEVDLPSMGSSSVFCRRNWLHPHNHILIAILDLRTRVCGVHSKKYFRLLLSIAACLVNSFLSGTPNLWNAAKRNGA